MKFWNTLTVAACFVFLASCTNVEEVGERDPLLIYLTIKDGTSLILSEDLDQNTGILYSSEEVVFEFAPSRNGEFLVLVLGNDRGGSDLWRIDQDGSNIEALINCGQDRCSAPTWSPDGSRIAYSREASNPNSLSGFNPPRLWTVDSETGETSELMHDDHVLSGGASWSPDGRWLAFYDLVLDGIRILDLHTSSEQILTSGYGLVGSWSPDGNQIVFPVLQPVEDQFLTTLHVANVITQDVEVIVDEGMGWEEVGPPRWSPSGDWILIGAQTGEFGVGRQLWRVRPDGSEAQNVLLNPNFVHGGYQWDPTGDRIVFQRFSVVESEGEPEVVLWELGGEERLVAENAWLPAWLP